MLPLYRTLSLRYLRLRWPRAGLIVASIMLGVATLVATRVLNQTMSRATHVAVNPLAGAADLTVSRGDLGVHLKLAQQLKNADIPGVRQVTPLIVSRVLLPDLDNRSVWLFAADPGSFLASDDRWGLQVKIPDQSLWLPPRDPPPALVSRGLAADLGIEAPGSDGRLHVRVAGVEHTLVVGGTLGAAEGSPLAALGDNVLGMLREDAGRLLFPRRPDHVTRIDIAVEPDADIQEVKRLVAAQVGDQGDVQTPTDSDRSLQDITSGLEVGFILGGLGALVVGLFLVYNAMSVSVAERRHDIGILRSVGATRGQVAALFAGEAALLGLAGSALGIPLGLGLASICLGPIQQLLSDIFLPIESRQIHIAWWTVLLALGAGVATSLLAALMPALSAAAEEPADAVRRVTPSQHRRMRLLQGAASALLIGAGLTAVALRETLGRTGTFGGLMIILVGALVSMPLLTAVLSRLLQPLARRFLGIESRLAADNLARSSARVGLVIGALAAGVSLMLQSAGVTFSSEDAILGWVEQRLTADLFVSANGPVTAGGQMVPMSAELGRQIANDPELRDRIDSVIPIRLHQLNYHDRIVFLVAIDSAAAYEAALRKHSTAPAVELYPRLRVPRERLDGPVPCLVSDNFASLNKVRVGDRLTLNAKNHPVEVEVIGSIVDYTWSRGTIFVDRDWYLKHFEDSLVDVYHIRVRPGEDAAAVRQALQRKWGKKEALVVLTRQELHDGIRSLLRRLYGIAFAQEAVIGIVAALGVVMALLISVLQRRRELGLLRAVGATRAQVVRSVLAEATLMGLIGSVIGVLIGVPVEHYVIKVILLEEAGISFPALFPWGWAGMITTLALISAALAGLGPAIHAMRLPITEAIAYE
jgi:putative ABC transport system permease protein